MESVTTIREPARMPERQFGTTIWKKRCQNVAPRLAALSSRVLKSVDDSTASTARIMNGSVYSTWPTRMKVQLSRNPRIWP